MFRLIIFTLYLSSFTLLLTNALPRDLPKYDSRYDNIDVDAILKNERLMKAYIKCLMNEGPCTPDGQLLKDSLPDAIQNDCARCTEKQKSGSDNVMHYIIDKRPADWDVIAKLYDPDNVYLKKFCDEEENKAKHQCTVGLIEK
uniref:CSON007981 protein n=1 Tax=Culicoides sonorensis TaxID=179676 RepID=A0A336M3J4_CULSO